MHTYTHTNGHGVNRCVREGSDLGTLLGGVGGDDEDVDARVCIFMLNMTDTSYRFSTLVGCVCVWLKIVLRSINFGQNAMFIS